MDEPIEGIVQDAFWRKPAPGMLYYFMMTFESIAPNTLYVGDMASDREAALNAGIGFQWAEDFFRSGQ